MSKLLVTGGAGFIGTNFVYYWMDHHPDDEIIVLDALTYAGNPENLLQAEKNERYRFVKADIRDQELVTGLLRDDGIDTIVHFAAESHVDRSIHGPAAFLETNVNGTLSLLMAAKEIWLDKGSGREHRFHQVSTDEVYGTLGPDDPAFTEDTAFAPNSPYAASKAGADHMVRAYHHTFGLQVTTTNCSNNYGAYQFPEKLIPLVTLNILEGKALPIYGDGKQIRDWLEVNDHCRGIEMVLSGGRIGETYNIGGNCERQNIEIVKTICAALDATFASDPTLAKRYPDAPPAKGQPSESLITHVEDRLGHDRRYAVNAGKITSELGYAPAVDFESGFARMLEWYLANETWWQHVRDDSYREWVTKNYGSA